MELKKVNSADVNSKSGIYRDIGILVVIIALIISFSIKKETKESLTLNWEMEIDREEEVLPDISCELYKPAPPATHKIRMVEDHIKFNTKQTVLEEVEIPANFEVDYDDLNPIKWQTLQEPIFTVVEQMPHFPGSKEESDQKMMEFIWERLTYPESEKQKEIEGMVFVQFIVEKNGVITGISTAKGTESRSTLAMRNEAKRVVAQMPRWIPGEQRGKPVRVKFTLPVRFRLEK